MSTAVSRTQTTEDDITNETLRRVEGTPDPRTREIMVSLIKHLHGFVKDVQLTEAEWFEGIRFLTDTGQMCNDIRDRKSTRLNSSHVEISYAVFCLKKKKVL